MKFITLILLVCMLFLCGCNSVAEPNCEQTEPESVADTQPETEIIRHEDCFVYDIEHKYSDTSVVTFYEDILGKAILALEESEASQIVDILNCQTWTIGTAKMSCDFHLEIGESKEIVDYEQEDGYLGDSKNNRHTYLSAEDKELINSLLFKENVFSDTEPMFFDTSSIDEKIELVTEARQTILSVINGSKWTVGVIEDPQILYDI